MVKMLSTLPVGAKIKFGKYQVDKEARQDLIWEIAGQNHNGYPANSTTLITEKIIDYRGFDAKEPNNSDSSRRSYGNNRYKHSNLRQWLNKQGFDWFNKQHSSDEAPTNAGTRNYNTGYDNKEGFLSAFNSEELSIILNTDLKVAKNTVTDGGGLENVIDKVFLLSRTEVGLGNETGGAEGSKLPLFTNDTSRVCPSTQQAFTRSNNTNKPSAVNSAWYWWLRSPHSGNSSIVRTVNTSGALDSNIAFGGNFGVRPALNLKSDIGVSDNPDSNGVYTLVYNAPPTISGEDKDLGNVSGEISETYTVFDEDNDKLSIVERLNNKVLNYYNDVASGTTKTVDIAKEKIYSLPIGELNTISIEVSDGTETVFRKWTFTRTNTAPIIQVLSVEEQGEVIDSFNNKVKVSDPEHDKVDLKYTVNKIVLNENDVYERVPVYSDLKEDIALDTEIDYIIPKNIWKTLIIGDYELEIKAIDDQSGENKEIITFTRTEDEIEFITPAIVKDVQPKQSISLWLINGNPTNIKIEACNNGLDDKPSWEDVTAEATEATPYSFKNNTKTADKWAVMAKVSLDGKGGSK